MFNDILIEKYMMGVSKDIKLNEEFLMNEDFDIVKAVKKLVDDAKKKGIPRSNLINNIAWVLSNKKKIDMQAATRLATKMI